jgi:hypothetical protein
MTVSQPDRLDILIDQVGRLTEAVTVGFSKLEAVSERQEQNISRLVGIVETLMQREQNRSEG